MRRHTAYIFCIVLLLNTNGCGAREVPNDWKTDCVGRMQLSFPGDVDVAANSEKMMLAEYKERTAQPQFELPDGQNAGWSAASYLGSIFVTPPLDKEAHAKLATEAMHWVKQAKERATKNKRMFEELQVAPHEGVASRINANFGVSIFVNNSLVRIASASPDEDWPEQRKNLLMFISGVAPRSFGSVPQAPGVCLPYVFIRDDETPGRSIGTTYRLKDHPDITVWLEDSNAAGIGPGQNPDKFTPVSKSDFFWTQEYGSGVRKTVRSIWAIPYRKIDFAGQKGVESFVRIVRNDDAEDFGYLAVARGDPKAAEDTPDLMLYVIRDAQNAKSKGIEPVSKEAFLEMAQTIAASVKRRPTH